MKVINARSMKVCPYCVQDGALVKLAEGRVPGRKAVETFCQFHGQISGIVRDEPSVEPPRGKSR